MLRQILAIVGLLMLLYVAGLGARWIFDELTAQDAPATMEAAPPESAR